MKYFYLFLVSLIFLAPTAHATTYFWFWVNGDTAHVTTQGDTIAWEIDVATPGNRVDFEIYLDMDASRDVSEGDILLQQFDMSDGEFRENEPSDSSAVPDGILYFFIGPFGFAAGDYLITAMDAEGSPVTGWFSVLAMSDPPATISGNIFIEGTDAPDPLYANVMIGAMGQGGIFSGLTDENGTYSINLSQADLNWEVSPFFEGQLPGYINSNDRQEVFAPAGNTPGINFYYDLPVAWVYGELRDQGGQLIDRNTYVGLENETTGAESYTQVQEGRYVIPATVEPQGGDSTNFFRIRVDDDGFYPDYMQPRTPDAFAVAFGDSVEVNLTAYETDTTIFGYVTENGDNPTQAYEFRAYSDTFGYSYAESDPATGYFELPVRDGSFYNISIDTDPQWGTPPPDGFALDGPDWRDANPGDTVYYNFIPVGGRINGFVSFEEGEAQYFDSERYSITARDTGSAEYRGRVDNEDTYSLAVPDGNYSVSFDSEPGADYLALPFQHDNITVNDDTVNNVNFQLNYAHANVTVKLVYSPMPEWWWEDFTVFSQGQWPNVYMARQRMNPDTSYNFRLCEGLWTFRDPFENYPEFDYTVSMTDTVLTITEDDSSFYIEFRYQLAASIEERDIVPAESYLSQNYPNPFNPATTIEFGISKPGRVKLKIFNLLGERVAELVDEDMHAGTHRVTWHAADMASGIYIYRLEAEGAIRTKKLLFIK